MVTMPMKRLASCLYCAGMLMAAGQARAIGLLDAYNDALQNDPVYRSAIHDNEAGRENRTLARSNFLPNVAINYSGSKNFAETEQPGQGGTSTSYPKYISSTGGLTVRQPLFSPDGVARYHEGMAQADLSDAQFSSRKQDLLIRLLGAYVDVLRAQDTLSLAASQRDTYAEQRQSNDKMFIAGEGTKTDMLETQAKLDFAEEQVIEAKDAFATFMHALEAIVGHSVTRVDDLSESFHVIPLQPSSFEDWRALALQHNPDLQAQRFNVEVAHQEISRNRAGHLPHVDLIASVTKDKADTIDTYTTDSTVRSVGVQVTVPLYSGGSVSAQTRQANATYEKSLSDLDDKINQLMLDMHKQHYAVLSSAAKIDALTKSEESAKLLVVATKQSVKGGVRVNLDLLSAEQQLYNVRRDLAQAKYAYLVADMKLRADAGVLTVTDLNNIAGYFSSAR